MSVWQYYADDMLPSGKQWGISTDSCKHYHSTQTTTDFCTQMQINKLLNSVCDWFYYTLWKQAIKAWSSPWKLLALACIYFGHCYSLSWAVVTPYEQWYSLGWVVITPYEQLYSLGWVVVTPYEQWFSLGWVVVTSYEQWYSLGWVVVTPYEQWYSLGWVVVTSYEQWYSLGWAVVTPYEQWYSPGWVVVTSYWAMI